MKVNVIEWAEAYWKKGCHRHVLRGGSWGQRPLVRVFGPCRYRPASVDNRVEREST